MTTDEYLASIHLALVESPIVFVIGISPGGSSPSILLFCQVPPLLEESSMI